VYGNTFRDMYLSCGSSRYIDFPSKTTVHLLQYSYMFRST